MSEPEPGSTSAARALGSTLFRALHLNEQGSTLAEGSHMHRILNQAWVQGYVIKYEDGESPIIAVDDGSGTVVIVVVSDMCDTPVGIKIGCYCMAVGVAELVNGCVVLSAVHVTRIPACSDSEAAFLLEAIDDLVTGVK